MPKLSCGIVGLPNVGKSTLFNALTACGAEASNYPFCTIEPNTGIVEVYDPRLEVLSKISGSKKILYATTTFVDIAGIVKGASEGEGLGNKFLSNIRDTEVIAHVVRCFANDDVVHVAGKVDPVSDIEVINTELILADLQMVENSIQRLEKAVKGKKELESSIKLLKRVEEHLNQGKPVRSMEFTPQERELIAPYAFITLKKVIYVANVSEEALPTLENEYVAKVRAYAEREGSQVIPICAKLEAEISELEPAERREYLASMGLQMSGLQRLINASFNMLGLITYLTTGEQETRAWTIREGDTAYVGAAEIHTDIQKGFAKAEVVSYDDMVACHGRAGAREKGKLRVEGRDYILKDGDVVLFLHHS